MTNLRHVTSLQVQSVLLKFLRCCFSGLIGKLHIALSVSVGVPAANVARGVMEIHRSYSAADNFTKASCQAWLKLLIANEVRIGGPGGGGFKTDHFEAVPELILVTLAVVFEADVPRGNWVTVGFDSPLVRPSTCIGGRREWMVK